MSGRQNTSQKQDINDICDAVVNSIKSDVAAIAADADSTTLDTPEIQTIEVLETISEQLGEILYHLRIITDDEDYE